MEYVEYETKMIKYEQRYYNILVKIEEVREHNKNVLNMRIIIMWAITLVVYWIK